MVKLKTPTRPATKAQQAFLVLLAYESCEAEGDELIAHAEAFARMTMQQASELISLWKALPRQRKAPKELKDAMERAREHPPSASRVEERISKATGLAFVEDSPF